MTDFRARSLRLVYRLGCLSAALLTAGCGDGMYPVRGKVVWSDGSPATELVGGVVSFESIQADLNARGEIGPDASFSLSSLRKDDGLPPGTYQVTVAPSDPDPSEDKTSPRIKGRKMLPAKYKAYKTSGLSATVEAGKNDVTLTVDKQQK